MTLNADTTLYAVWEKNPGTRAGNFTVTKSFVGLDADVTGPKVILTYEAWRTKDNSMVVGRLGDGQVGEFGLGVLLVGVLYRKDLTERSPIYCKVHR